MSGAAAKGRMQAAKRAEKFEAIINFMNTKRQVTLILIAWSYFGKTDVIKAQMSEIDSQEFSLLVDRVNWLTGVKSQETLKYKFSQILSDPFDCRTELTRLERRCSLVSWPPGIVSYLILFAWFLILVAMAKEPDIVHYTFVRVVNPYALWIFQSRAIAGYIMVAGLIAHSIEAAYVAYIFRRIRLSSMAMVTWCSLVLIVGFPFTKQVMLLGKIGEKARKYQ
jgi:hypothetical protein